MGGTPESILIGFFLINPPFWDTSIYGNPHMANSNGEVREKPPMITASALTHGLRHHATLQERIDYLEKAGLIGWRFRILDLQCSNSMSSKSHQVK